MKIAVDRIHQKNLDNEYAPIAGLKDFVEHAAKLAFITDTTGVIQDKRYAAIQSLSGTGALRIAGEFINRFKHLPIYLPNPTWGNHIPIFEDSGLKVHNYRYYNPKTKGLDFKGLLEDLDKIPQSAVLFHTCAHNPTGVDPSLEQVLIFGWMDGWIYMLVCLFFSLSVLCILIVVVLLCGCVSIVGRNLCSLQEEKSLCTLGFRLSRICLR